MRVAKVFIWLGFIALLAISIPKVAWVVRSYEGATPLLVTQWDIAIDVLWILPLFVAICIDVLILALTYAVSNDKARASQISMWGFVALLCGISVYCNLLYNEAHRPGGSIWDSPLVSVITPYILAGVPLFALCYTLILSRINGNAETLDEKATRLENERVAKERIHQAKQGRVTSMLKNAISGVADVTSYAIDQLPKKDTHQTLPETQSLPTMGSNGHSPETFTGHSPDIQTDTSEIQTGYSEDTHQDAPETQSVLSPDTHQDTMGILTGHRADREEDAPETFTRHTTDKLRILSIPDLGYSPDIQEDREEDAPETFTRHNGTSSNGSTSLLYVSIEDAANHYGYSPDYLAKLVSTGKVRTKRNDRNQLLNSSLKSYVEKHGRRKQGDTSTSLPALQVVND
jgi:hypothetical protein